MKARIRKFTVLIKKHRGEIAYYAGVLLVLGILAGAAEAYRGDRQAEETHILPAVELTLPEEPSEAQFSLQGDMRRIALYSGEPVWNGELGCWQTHTAVDYACPDGTVYALAGGEVLSVGESGVYGGYVEQMCGNILLRYCSIVPCEGIEPGMPLKKGEELGSASDSMPGESHLGQHLHLEASRDGELINYEMLLP